MRAMGLSAFEKLGDAFCPRWQDRAIEIPSERLTGAGQISFPNCFSDCDSLLFRDNATNGQNFSAMMEAYFDSADLSDVGRKRKNNEDACLRLPDKGIFCVADGMGGITVGDLASEA